MNKPDLTIVKMPIFNPRAERTVTETLEKVLDNLDNLDDIIVFGRYRDESLYFFTSLPLCKDVLWELEVLKNKLMFEKP